MTGLHPRELLHELLDGRLEAPERSALDRHLQGCPACRAELAALQATQRILRAMAEEPVPGRPRGGRSLGWAAAAAGLLLVLLAVGWLLRGRAPGDLVAQADAQWAALTASPELLEIRSPDAEAIDRFFRDRRLPFPSRVFDLAMMGWQLEGARLVELDGRETSVWTYRAADGRRLACLMLLGSLSELPPADRTFRHDGRAFRVYRRHGRTVVFWPEGRVLCALVGLGESEVIELARAKAMGPP